MTKELLEIYPADEKFSEDIQEAELPFDLISALSGVVKEIVSKDFQYIKLTKDGQNLLTFEKPDERIIISVALESLLIRHFDVDDNKRKLRVLYIAKPAQRKFKLL